jgi:phosphotransferase system enzyme I (PtsP)
VGLVGELRELVVLNNATAHPRYAPAAETGGCHFDGFLRVPLIHYHHVLGILVAWRRVNGQFDKDEVSFFVTIAAQLAKVIYEASNLQDVVEHLRNETGENAFIQGIQGIQAATGLAIGITTLIHPLANLKLVPNRRAENINAQEFAFRAAVVVVQAELSVSSERLDDGLLSELRELFDVYIMLLGSDSLVADTLERIRAGNWAPGAWRDTVSEHAGVFDQMEDP